LRLKIGELRQLAGVCVHAVQIGPVFALRADEQSLVPVVPAVVREVEVVGVAPVGGELPDTRPRRDVYVIDPFRRPDASLAHVACSLPLQASRQNRDADAAGLLVTRPGCTRRV